MSQYHNPQYPVNATRPSHLSVGYFLRQVETHHVQTPNHTPIPLHYDSKVGSMATFPWPLNPETETRVPPSKLEAYRRTHHFRGPCCLCAFASNRSYTEAKIGIVETFNGDKDRNCSVLHGEYVATCATQACGYFLCLERFYPVRGLKVQVYAKRGTYALGFIALMRVFDVPKSFRAGDGLFQVMTDSVIRGRPRCFQVINPVPRKVRDAIARELWRGVNEDRFWDLFVQCLVCKTVALRQAMSGGHNCSIADGGDKRYHPYGGSYRGLTAHVESIPGDVPQSSQLRSLSPSPTPTEIIPETEDETGEGLMGGPSGNEDPLSDSESLFNEVPPLDREPELPTLMQILRGEA
ncbi:hypothetical protein FA13DRAFT_1803135 [Coprinellus micaceus]|uniref:Uncharacterized protein n=1 Tax=Coprinellus micaceus TaxID=71717 RepID=A0A4Y7SAQ7_COPMI|nr:hypothetical protein FA13DRAFT_1803135 [Coprinellus micaceus]